MQSPWSTRRKWTRTASRLCCTRSRLGRLRSWTTIGSGLRRAGRSTSRHVCAPSFMTGFVLSFRRPRPRGLLKLFACAGSLIPSRVPVLTSLWKSIFKYFFICFYFLLIIFIFFLYFFERLQELFFSLSVSIPERTRIGHRRETISSHSSESLSSNGAPSTTAT